MPQSAEGTVAPSAGASPVLFEKLRPGPGRSAAKVADHQRARIHSAMLQIVGERGYSAVTARELAQLSGVSTRAFYEHFASKEECFLRTHELLVRRTARSVVAAQAGGRDGQECLRLGLNAFLEKVSRDSNAGRLALLEVYSAGPVALHQVRRGQCTFEAVVAESLRGDPEGVAMPQLVIEGIVAGIERVATARLTPGREKELPRLGDPLTEWALSYCSQVAARLDSLDCRAAFDLSASPSLPVQSSNAEEAWPQSPAGDCGLLLSAVAKLAAARGYEHLTPARIRAVAGVSRRSFEAHFDSVEDCFLAAQESRARETIARAAGVTSLSRSWVDGVHRVIASLCGEIAADPVLASLCFYQVFAPPGGLRCRERLTGDLAALLRGLAPSDERIDDLFAEASAGAILGVIHHHVVSGRAHRLPRIAPTLAYLALAPVLGARSAVDAIEREADGIVRKQRTQKLDRSSNQGNGPRVDAMAVLAR